MIVQTESPMDFYQLDSVTFVNHIQKQLTSLEEAAFRQQLEKTFWNKLTAPQTVILKASDYFDVNTLVSFYHFKKKIIDLDVDAILLINVTDYRYNTLTHFPVNTQQNNLRQHTSSYETSEPIAGYNCYLVDCNTLQPAWIARVTVNGIYLAGYETLNNRLAAKVGAKLRRDGYIYPLPRY